MNPLPADVHPHRRACSRNLLLVLLLALSTVFAQPAPEAWTVERAVEAALQADADLSSLHLDLETAERNLRRANLDPLASAQERMSAEHAVAAAQSAIETAVGSLRIEVLTAFAAVLQAEDALAAAAGATEVAQREAEAAQVRFQAGAITEAALIQVRSSADAAARDQRDAAIALDTDWNDLADQLGVGLTDLREAGLVDLSEDPPALPDLEADLTMVVELHSNVTSAERSLISSQVQLAAVDHEASTPNEVADARADVSTAERRLEDARRSASQGLRSAYQNWVTASERLADARLDLESARTTFEAQTVRYQVGELSPIAFLQAELSLAASEASLRVALHSAHLAWWRYLQAQVG